MKVYGITSCTTVRKARAWLDAHGLAHTFVDFKKSPPDAAMLQRWVEALGWETVLNRRGTTWRGLPADAQARVVDGQSATAAMLAHPSLIKRPVVETADALWVGFDEAGYERRLAAPAGAVAR